MKKEADVYPRPLGQLPKNENTYILTSVGEVSFDHGPSEPVWKTHFSHSRENDVTEVDDVIIRLGGSLLRAASLGSVWKSRKNIGFKGDLWPRLLNLKLPDRILSQRIVYRLDGLGLKRPRFLDKHTPSLRPYLLLDLLGEPKSDFVLISCFEVYRYYYGYLRSVARHFFSFDRAGNNPKLFNAATTGWDKENPVFNFDPTPNITDLDQKLLAHYLVSNVAREAIGLTAASARAQAARKEAVLPVCRVPIIGVNRWHVAGQIRDIDLPSYSEQPLRVIAVNRIVDCFDKGRVPNVESKREQTDWHSNLTDNLDDNGNNIRPLPPTLRDEQIPVISDRAFGNPVSISSYEADNNPFNRAAWNQTTYKRIGPKKEIHLRHTSDTHYPPILTVTTNDQSGGDQNTGKFGNENAAPQSVKSKGTPVTEEEYRTHLEHIFSFKAPGQITSEEISVDRLPVSLKYLFRSATYYFDGRQDRFGCFLGGDSKIFFEDVVSVYILDPNWGPNTRCRASKHGVRRALVLEIPTHTGFLYFFDLEKKKNEKIGIHVMLFNGRSLTDDQIASILYRRLEGREHRGWPKRSQYAGEFWSGTLYHYEGISPEESGAQIATWIMQMGGV